MTQPNKSSNKKKEMLKQWHEVTNADAFIYAFMPTSI